MSKRKPAATNKAKRTSREESSPSALQILYRFLDAHARKIVGLLVLALGIYLAVALSSYFFTWQLDQDLFWQSEGWWGALFGEGKEAANTSGRLGAWLSHLLIYRGFGPAALFLSIFMVIWGLNLLLPRRLVSSLKVFFRAVLLTLLGAACLAWIFPAASHAFPYGGDFGNGVMNYLYPAAGKLGAGILMTGLTLLLLALLFGPLASLPMWHSLYERLRVPSPESRPTPAGEGQVIPIAPETETPEYPSDLPPHVAPEPQPESSALAGPETGLIQEPHTEPEPQPEPEPQRELELQPAHEAGREIHLDPIEDTPTPGQETNLTLEVVTPETSEEPIPDSHITVAGDEPYDPSLELSNYRFPTIDLLEQRSGEEISIDKNELEQNKNQIINTLKSFGIAIAKISATVGPTVTLYEIVPAEGVRISKIRNLEDDIALSLSALGIRIIAPIPGKGTIGIEVPNLRKQFVSMRTLLASEKFIHNDFSLPIALGKKIDNENYIVDLAKMPHLLMAGATGQGKSVGINTILVSLLYKKHPSQLKFVMVDPKKVELSIYKHIEKHFLAKLPNEDEAIITDTKKVINTLNALCIEMDNRYDLLKDAGVRNIREYNDKFIRRKLLPTKGHKYLPFIVLVVDEFADLIMTAGKEVELPIARIAQLARAVGIHCIIATQRPSVNVITGTIKANFPARVAFKVSAKVDSRTILDAGGAEQLIGQGDMLILNGSELVRLQCAFVDTPEVERIVEFIGDQQGYPTAFDLPEYEGADGGDLGGGGSRSLQEVDTMFEQCARLVVSSGSGSTSMLQRRFNLGYNRAGRIMDQLEAAGVVGASIGGKPRELLVHTEVELEELLRSINRP